MKEYLKLLKFVRPFVWHLVLATFCMILSTVFSGVELGMIVPLSDRVMTDKDIVIPSQVPDFVASFITYLNSLSPAAVLRGLAAAILVLFFLKGLFVFFQSYLMNVIGQGVVRDVKDRLYRKFQDLSLDFYSRQRTGELMSRVTNDTVYISQAISSGLADLLFQSMQVLMFTFLVFRIYWKLALFSLILFPLILYPVIRMGKKIKKFTTETQRKIAELNSHLSETLQGAYIIKVFGRENYEYLRFKETNAQYFRYVVKRIKRLVALSPFTEVVGAAGATGILLLAGNEVIAGKLSFGIFAFFIASLMSMIKPFKKLSAVHAVNQQALAASSRIYAILEEEPSIREKADALPVSGFSQDILFDHVFFRYLSSEGYALKDIVLPVKKHDIIALVGHSGAGKTTLVNLIPRLYDVSGGSIRIDGQDLRDVKLDDLRRLISVVSQEMILFNDTVRNNIGYGRDRASFEDIVDAARKANAYDFIMALPKQFDTVVGDRGFRLSGGEKQRLSIARAILKDSPILILDEATSQLDTKSERMIQDALDFLMQGKTVFVIAHRLSTVQHATRIVVLDKGKIVEQGTHQELLQIGKVYRKLYQLQFNDK